MRDFPRWYAETFHVPHTAEAVGAAYTAALGVGIAALFTSEGAPLSLESDGERLPRGQACVAVCGSPVEVVSVDIETPAQLLALLDAAVARGSLSAYTAAIVAGAVILSVMDVWAVGDAVLVRVDRRGGLVELRREHWSAIQRRVSLDARTPAKPSPGATRLLAVCEGELLVSYDYSFLPTHQIASKAPAWLLKRALTAGEYRKTLEWAMFEVARVRGSVGPCRVCVVVSVANRQRTARVFVTSPRNAFPPEVSEAFRKSHGEALARFVEDATADVQVLILPPDGEPPLRFRAPAALSGQSDVMVATSPWATDYASVRPS